MFSYRKLKAIAAEDEELLEPMLRAKSLSYGALNPGEEDSSECPRRHASTIQNQQENVDDEAQMSNNDQGLLTGSAPALERPSGNPPHWKQTTPPLLPTVPHDSSKSRKKDKLGQFSARDKLTIGLIALTAFLCMIAFSCIAPFFPEEAEQKGASQTVIGFIFAIFELVIFVTAPIFGRYLSHIGANFMFSAGLCVTGVTSILFGLLNRVQAGRTFIIFAFLIRTVEALGDSACTTSSFVIVARANPLRAATVIGTLETFVGLGFAAGPPIGGALYELGGFPAPLAVVGCLLLVIGLPSFWILPKKIDLPVKPKGSIFGLLRMPTIFTAVFATTTASISVAFLEPTLQLHVNDLGLSPFLVGLMFLILSAAYAICASLFGFMIDRRDCARHVLLFGCAAIFISLLLVGPSPVVPFQKNTWMVAISLGMMGVGVAAIFIPPFQLCFATARKNGYPETLETYGLISGVYQSAQAFGAFAGPALGGIGVDGLGFPWTATLLALLQVFNALLITYLIVAEKRSAKVTMRADIQLLPTDSNGQLP